MKRSFAYLLAAGSIFLAVAGIIVYNSGGGKAPTVEEALGSNDNSLSPVFAKRLYPRVEATEGQDSPPAESVQISSRLWVTLQDKSTVDIELKPGTRDQIVSSRSYFAIQPGESGRRPHVIQLYGTLPGVALDETVLRLDGTRAEHTQVMDDKSKHVVDYGPDGTTYVGEQHIAPTEYNAPRLMLEERWRLDAEHTLKYRNQSNPDETRTITEYDEHLRPLRIIQMPKNDIAAGSTAVAYYPGSFKLRMQAKSDFYSNDVQYLREDGTLEYNVNLSPSMTTIKYFDATGKVPTMEQDFFRYTKVDHGVSSFTYKLYIVKTFDAQGNETRNVDYNTDTMKMREDQHSNLTVGGTKWFRVDYHFDENEFLHEVTFWLTEVKFPPQKKEEHKPEENLHPDPVPAEYMTPRVTLEDDLPIPPPQNYHGY